MTYRTILVHCPDKRRAETIIGSAVKVAETFQSHLIGLSIAPPVLVVPTGMPGNPDTMVIDELRQTHRKDNPEMRAIFEAAVRGRGFTAEWREEEAGNSTVADVALRHSRAVDLIIAAQRDPLWSGSTELDIADRLTVEAGRPVVLMPNAGVPSHFGDRVLVAWNGRREAARATFDGLPLLQRAKDVKVLWVNQPHAAEQAEIHTVDICTALARHGVICEAVEAASLDGNIGRDLLRRAIEYRADLLVMGCYGHSRLREFVFGGATRHVLQHMITPVLMSH